MKMTNLSRRFVMIVAVAGALLLAGFRAGAAVVVFEAGSMIIPMDTGAQNNGMLRAYGLVYTLLQNGVQVCWVVDPAKAAGGDDFVISGTGTLQNVRTGAAIALPRSYRGGPFVIAASNAAAALPFIVAWQATVGDATTVHRMTSGSFQGDVARTLVAAPRIAVLADGYEQIAFNDLNAAGIPDASGRVWSASSPDILTEAAVAGTTNTTSDGALFHQPGTLVRHGFLSAMHYASTPTTPNVVQEVRSWLDSDLRTHLFAQCEAARSIENAAGGFFLTNAGVNDDGSATASPTIRVPAHPLAQLDGTFGTDSGSFDSMKANDAPGATPDYKTGVQTVINDNASLLTERIVLLAGRMDGDGTNGYVTYLAGHDFSLILPITSNPQTQGVRVFLNALFMSDCATDLVQPDPAFSVTAPSWISSTSITYTIICSNSGARPLEYARITDPLPTGTVFAGATDGGTNQAGVVTWDIPTIQPGSNTSVSVTVNASSRGIYTNTPQVRFSHMNVRTLGTRAVTTNFGLTVISSLATNSDSFGFTLQGSTGNVYEIKTGTNLTSWSLLKTITNDAGTSLITDPFDTNSTIRFYRADLVP